MRTQTTSSTVTLQIPKTINFMGNKNGNVVKRLSEKNYTGDGDINTGHGGKVYTSFLANCEAEGASAKISVAYQVWNSDYGTAKNADCLYFKGVHYESLSNYDNDFNIFFPYIPLDKIRQNEKGEWEFKVHIDGTTLFNAKNNIELSYTVPGAFVSKNDNWFRGELKDSEYVGKSEEYILTQYFNYCERMYCLYDNFQRLTGEKAVKTRRE